VDRARDDWQAIADTLDHALDKFTGLKTTWIRY